MKLFRFQRAFFAQSTIDGLDVRSAYNIAGAARDGFRNITTQFEVSVENSFYWSSLANEDKVSSSLLVV